MSNQESFKIIELLKTEIEKMQFTFNQTTFGTRPLA